MNELKMIMQIKMDFTVRVKLTIWCCCELLSEFCDCCGFAEPIGDCEVAPIAVAFCSFSVFGCCKFCFGLSANCCDGVSSVCTKTHKNANN